MRLIHRSCLEVELISHFCLQELAPLTKACAIANLLLTAVAITIITLLTKKAANSAIE